MTLSPLTAAAQGWFHWPIGRTTSSGVPRAYLPTILLVFALAGCSSHSDDAGALDGGAVDGGKADDGAADTAGHDGHVDGGAGDGGAGDGGAGDADAGDADAGDGGKADAGDADVACPEGYVPTGGGCVPTVNLPPANLFIDGFETADMSATNADGFAWANNNRTSVVTQDPEEGPVAVYNNGAIRAVHDSLMPDGTTRDWTAYEGQHSLRFNYPADEAWSEQRFDMGQPQKDLWIRFWLRVPLNYVHGSVGTPRNQKLFSIWMDGYSSQGDGSTVWLGFWPSGDGTDSEVAITYSRGGNTASIAFQQYVPFIDSSQDKGRWMQIVFHVAAETTPGAADGVIETWRRWADEDAFTKWHETFTADIKVAADGPNGFQRGYLMGWANGAYANDTEWLLDLFELSTQPLVPGY